MSQELKSAIQLAKKNIECFHKGQKESIKARNQTVLNAGEKVEPLEKLVYISLRHCTTFFNRLNVRYPAKLAGCAEIVLYPTW